MAEKVTEAERDEAVRRLKIYKRWFMERFMSLQDTGNTVFILPTESIKPRYRDQPSDM